MSDSVVITFAELGFLLQACPTEADLVRATLRLDAATATDVVVAAGLASLLARGLAVRTDSGEVEPTPALSGITAGVSRPEVSVSALGWLDDRLAVAHVFSGPHARLALYPRGFGQYGTELLDPAEPLSVVLGRFLDTCLTDHTTPSVLFRGRGGLAESALVIHVDDVAMWHLSDSVGEPDRAMPVEQAEGRRRLAELFDGEQPAVVVTR